VNTKSKEYTFARHIKGSTFFFREKI